MTSSANLSLALNTKVSKNTSGTLGQWKNKIINGDFLIWQRNTSFSGTLVGYVADRWRADQVGSTGSITAAQFIVGSPELPGNPLKYMHYTVNSVAGAGNYSTFQQRIEYAQTFSGETVTVTFWARSDANRNMTVELTQYFGSGGSPSAAVTGIGTRTVALTPFFQKFSYTVNVPSVYGKALGTAGNDYINIVFWLEAGSTFASRANNIGQQSGTFDIARVSIVSGDETGVDDPFYGRSGGEEVELCQRFYQIANLNINAAGGATNTYVGAMVPLNNWMRTTPAVISQNFTGSNNAAGGVINPSGPGAVEFVCNPSSANAWVKLAAVVTLDAEL